MKRRTLLLTTLAVTAALNAPAALAQGKPIRIIVPYAPGGPIDVTARQLAERVKDSLGVVIIENRPGGGGNIGADAVAKAAPDGLTIGIAAVATHAINPWLFSKMPYNAATDFAPITQMLRVPNVLVMNADTAARLKINTLADLIAYAKANPAKLNYGSGGNGSAGHLAGEMFKRDAGIFAVHIPDNVDKCVDYVLEQGPALPRGHQTWMMNEVNKLIWPSTAGIGQMDAALFEQTAGIAVPFNQGLYGYLSSRNIQVSDFNKIGCGRQVEYLS